MSVAERTRAAVRSRPFLLEALRAGVVNYAAAARAIDVADDTDAVATALRRFAEDLPSRETTARDVRVTMHGGIESGAADPLLAVGDAGFGDGDGPYTAVLATGDVDATALSTVIRVLEAHGLDPAAAGVAESALVVVVPRRDGPEAVQRVEGALTAVPTRATG